MIMSPPQSWCKLLLSLTIVLTDFHRHTEDDGVAAQASIPCCDVDDEKAKYAQMRQTTLTDEHRNIPTTRTTTKLELLADLSTD